MKCKCFFGMSDEYQIKKGVGKSPTSQFDYISFFFQFSLEDIALITLNFNCKILDGPPNTAFLLEFAPQFLEFAFVEGYAGNDT